MQALVKAVEDFQVIASKFPQVYLEYPFLQLCQFIMEEKYIAKQLAANMPVNTVIWQFEKLHQASNKCKNIVFAQ
jgi:hypothetical protein